MIVIACIHCGQRFQVKDEMGGTQGRCPQCQKPIALPASSLTNFVSDVKPITKVEATVAAAAGAHSSDDEYGFLAPPQRPDEMGRLGAYRVLKVLGAGGMGVVFLAEDVQLKRRVALKAIKPGQGSAQAKQRFVREAQATAQLKHDHVVTIYQVGEGRGAPFLAMEFLQGEPLDVRLKREGKLPILEALRIVHETVEGLTAAHAAGLVHRDIKPGNLWLEAPKGRVKILDFGLARGGTEDIQLTQDGAIVGTPAYMTPEQALGRKVDARADLFSVGCVLYRLVTGELPFQGPDTISTCLAVAHEAPVPPREHNPAVSPVLAAFILRLLAKKPEERPQTAGAVVEELTQLERAREATAMIPTAFPVDGANRGPRQIFRRLTWKQRLLIGGSLFLLPGLLWLLLPSGPKSGAESKDTATAKPVGDAAPTEPSQEKPFVLQRKAGGIHGEYQSLALVVRQELAPQVEDFRRRFKDLGELGPNWDHVGPGDAYVKALKAAGQPAGQEPAPADGPIVLVRDRKVFRAVGTLQDAVNAAQDGDVIEIRSNGEFAGCTMAAAGKGVRKLTIRGAPGYSPTIAGVSGISFGAGTELTVEGLRFHNVGLIAEARPVPVRSGRLVRVANCSFEGTVPNANLGVFCRIMAGDTDEGRARFEVVNCLITAGVEWQLQPRRTLSLQNSVLGTVWVFPTGGGERRLELNRCLVWAAGDPLNRPLLIHGAGKRGQLSVEARNTLFAGACLLTGDAGALAGWKGERNVYRIGLRAWLHPSNPPIYSLDDLRRAYNSGDLGSIWTASYLDVGRQWQVMGPPEARGFGAEVDKVARTLPAEKK